jgi:hypothetical protein
MLAIEKMRPAIVLPSSQPVAAKFHRIHQAEKSFTENGPGGRKFLQI